LVWFGFYRRFIEPIPVIRLNTHRKRSPLLFFYQKTRGPSTFIFVCSEPNCFGNLASTSGRRTAGGKKRTVKKYKGAFGFWHIAFSLACGSVEEKVDSG
jgi:hypothetical protein